MQITIRIDIYQMSFNKLNKNEYSHYNIRESF